jgi:hypothetical protein
MASSIPGDENSLFAFALTCPFSDTRLAERSVPEVDRFEFSK